MTDPLDKCPECGTLATERQMIDWMRSGVTIVYSCYECEIDFTVSLANPIKEVTHRYEGADA